MTSSELNSMLHEEVFLGMTVCDHAINATAGRDWFTNVTMNAKHPWVNCLDKHIQGSRINTLTEGLVPEDILYNGQAPLKVVQNLFVSAKRALREDREQRARARREQRPRGESAREKLERKFPKWHEQLRNRTMFARKVIEKEYGIPPSRLMFDAIVKADLHWFKYETGYYHFLMEQAGEVLARGDFSSFLPTKEDALDEVRRSFDELRTIMWRQPYGEITTATWHAARKISDAGWAIWEEGTHKWATRQWNTFDQHAKRTADPEQPARVALLKEAIFASPLYRMWFGVPPTNDTNSSSTGEKGERGMARGGIFGPFIDHMERVWAEYRSPEGVKNYINFWNADLHFWSLGDILTKRWEKPQWTQQNLEAWDQLRRVVHRIQHWWAPGSLTEEQKRFLYDSNCLLLDRTVNLTMQVVDYCTNEFVVNLDRRTTPTWMHEMAERSPHGGDHLYHGWRRRAHFTYERMPLSEEQNDPYAWRRPRLNWTSADAARIEARAHRERYHQVHPRVYRRAVVIPRRGPAGTDLYDQLVIWFEDVFQLAFASKADSWFDDLRAWILNPNKDISQFPDVGLAYWVRFPFICHFPESLNCSIGMGFERALLWTIVVFAGVVVLSAAVISLVDLPFRLLGYGIAFLIIFPAMAWHYSPWCAIPLPFVALPMCLADEIWAFLNKWITNCYVPLVLPAYMVAGETCPADPEQFIKVISCAQVGVRDGLQNILILGWWLFGSTFVDIVRQASTIMFSAFFPGVNHYFQVTMDAYVNAGPTDQERQVFCFYATLPAVVTPVALGVFALVILLALITAALALASAIVTLFMASPAAVAVTGTEGSTWFGPPDDDVPEDEDGDGDGDGDDEGGGDDDDNDGGGGDDDNAGPYQPVERRFVAVPVSARLDGGWLSHWMFGGPPTRRAAPSRETTPAAWTKKNQ